MSNTHLLLLGYGNRGHGGRENNTLLLLLSLLLLLLLHLRDCFYHFLGWISFHSSCHRTLPLLLNLCHSLLESDHVTETTPSQSHDVLRFFSGTWLVLLTYIFSPIINIIRIIFFCLLKFTFYVTTVFQIVDPIWVLFLVFSSFS